VTKPVVFAVAGAGQVKADTIGDLLDQWLEVEAETPRDVRAVYLPADATLTTKAVEHAAQWLKDVGLEYQAVKSSRPGRRGSSILKDATTAIPSGTDPIEALIEELAAHLDDSDVEVYLLLAWGDDPEQAADVATENLFLAARDAGITVLDLTAALYEITAADEENEEEPEGEGDDEPGGSTNDEPVDESADELPELTAEPQELAAADEAQATVRSPEPNEQDESDIPDLVTTLSFVYLALSNIDWALSAQRMERVRFGPLTLAVRHHLRVLLKDDLPNTLDKLDAMIAESRASKVRGKPRNTADDEVSVLIDESKQTVRLAGRGRPRRGEVQKKMKRYEFERLAREWGS